jgi:hypothetical protein
MKISMNYLNKILKNMTKESILRCFLFSLIPACMFYFISIAVLYESGFKIMEIVRDTAQQTGESSFLGFLSNIGIWLWISSAAICFFSLLNNHSESRDIELLFLVGILSFILAVDDFFMIHDRYIDQRICYLTYAFVAGTILLRHFNKIIGIDGFSFILAGSLLALSIVTDLIQGHIPLPYPVVQVFEEGFKFIGAAVWLYFSFKIASNNIAPIKTKL